jgi:hypothetical protein
MIGVILAIVLIISMPFLLYFAYQYDLKIERKRLRKKECKMNERTES